MIKITRYCSQCGKDMPFHWGKSFCIFCGGRVKLDVRQLPPREKVEDFWSGHVDLQKWKKKHFVPAERLTGEEEEEEVFFTGISAVSSFRFSRRSAVGMLLLNMLALGFASMFWIWHYLIYLNDSVKPLEKIRNRAVYAWIVSYLVMLANLLWGGYDFCMAAYDLSALLASPGRTFVTAVCMVYCLLSSKYFLLWIREVVSDEVEKGDRLTQRPLSRPFAPSALLLGFFGAPYIQSQINKMVKMGRLQGVKPRKKPKRQTQDPSEKTQQEEAAE